MGIINKAKAVAGTAAVVAGSVISQPSAAAQAGQHQNIQNQQRQTSSLTEATRAKGRPTTSGR